MADDDQNAGQGGDQGGGQKPEDKKPEDKKPDDNADLLKQVNDMKTLLEKQQAVIEKFKSLGSDPEPPKTDAERIAELEATLSVITKKLEADQNAQREAERKKREAVVDALIKDSPEFKDQREMLLKVDDTVLGLLSKQTKNTPDPQARTGGRQNDDWSKKLALASERRQKQQAALNAIKFN